MPWPNYTDEEKEAIRAYNDQEVSLYSPEYYKRQSQPKPEKEIIKPKRRKVSEKKKTRTYAIPVHTGTGFGGVAGMVIKTIEIDD
jgi:hypothetical protein